MTKDNQLESAITSAVTAAANAAEVKTDIGWMKGSLTKIEKTLLELTNTFVTTVEFTEANKILTKGHEDHEKRIRTIEENMWKWLGISAVVTSLLTIGIAALVNYITGL